MSVKILHNPRCSKSRATLALIEERGIKPDIIEYLKTPPSTEELQGILELLNLTARDIMRNGEAEYKQNNLADPDLSEAQLLTAMHQYPKVIQRPIVIANGKAIIGRPPENVLDIL